MARLVIFGAGDIARLAHYYFTRDSEHEVVAFTVDQQYLGAESFIDLPLIAFEEVVERYPPSDYKMFVALSYTRMNRVRAEKYARARSTDTGWLVTSAAGVRSSLIIRSGTTVLFWRTTLSSPLCASAMTLLCGAEIILATTP